MGSNNVDLKAQLETQLLRTQLELQAEKFKVASREIYDNISQVLAYVRFGILKAARQYQDENLETDSQLLVQVIRDLRNLNVHLDPDEITKKDMPSLLQEELERIEKQLNITTSIEVKGQPYALPENAVFIIFRSLQECMQNALTHGNPQNIALEVSYNAKDVIFNLWDDGSGFQIPSQFVPGTGLHTITHRARLAGVAINIQSAPGNGTHVTINCSKPEPDDKNSDS
ncbi:sensor histidine kinase [Deminuibacter soli]|uniref:histidine kinase n=1 Tax=Deminuibacter soli TaxID=2291815 RepID=A0A3E1NLK3_9BACT|nr:hypothetical protein [Deminuibacter soli]RFM28793.1 hypothetical protein DXN05_08435 [Deminuibacter soli]